MMKNNLIVLLIVSIGLMAIVSGCTGGQDVTSVVKALPEVQQFMNEHPNAKITVTYWSKDDVTNSSQEISQQCDKPITPVAMYKATVNEGDLKIISWINAENQIVVCSITQGSGNSQIPTSTPIQTQSAIKAPTASIVVSDNPDTQVPDLKISHKGGDTLKGGEWKVSLVVAGQPPLFKVSNGDFSVGDLMIATTTTCDFGNCPALSFLTSYDVKLVHIPSNALLLDQVVGVRSSSYSAPTASIVASNNPDTVGVDMKIQHKGGDILNGNEWKISIVAVGQPPLYKVSKSDFAYGGQIKAISTTCDAAIVTDTSVTGCTELFSQAKYDVKLVHIPSNAMLLDQVVEVRGDIVSSQITPIPIQTSTSTAVPTASITASNNPDTSGADLKIQHKGGDTLKSGEWKLSIVPVGNPPIFITSGSDFAVGNQIIATSTTEHATILTNIAISGGVTLAPGKYDIKLVHILSNAMLLDQVVEVR
ncbi:MAG: hypothetical protein Q7J35_03200 [Candidatus Methanoperedens sp.]|nr:hypothetical protein [Candidatus Methanoperedens sp.]